MQQYHLLLQRGHSHCPLSDHCSVCTAELQAVLFALKQAFQCKERKFIICSDPLSALKALGKFKTDHPMLTQMQKFLQKINVDQKGIVFVWVPGLVGIGGNKAADGAVKTTNQQLISCLFQT